MALSQLCRMLVAAVLVGGTLAACRAQDPGTGTEQDRSALAATDHAILEAFARGDVEAVMAYHHPDVVKGLSSDRLLRGREAVKADLAETMRTVHLEFKQNQVESTVFLGQSAVEITTFTIQGTPKNGGAVFLIKGRAMVVYVRSATSPTGWASIRELIQPVP
jgi:ketosteroid isomerase-like protein